MVVSSWQVRLPWAGEFCPLHFKPVKEEFTLNFRTITLDLLRKKSWKQTLRNEAFSPLLTVKKIKGYTIHLIHFGVGKWKQIFFLTFHFNRNFKLFRQPLEVEEIVFQNYHNHRHRHKNYLKRRFKRRAISVPSTIATRRLQVLLESQALPCRTSVEHDLISNGTFFPWQTNFKCGDWTFVLIVVLIGRDRIRLDI